METWQQLYFILWRQYKNKIILKLTKIRNRLQLFAGMSANKLTIIGRGWEKYRDLSVCEQINYFPKPKAEANNWSARHLQFMIFYHVLWSFDYQVWFLRISSGREAICHFSLKSGRKKEKSVVSITHEHNTICRQTQLNVIAHEQTIISRQLFAGHKVSFRPLKRKKHLHRLIKINN